MPNPIQEFLFDLNQIFDQSTVYCTFEKFSRTVGKSFIWQHLCCVEINGYIDYNVLSKINLFLRTL